MNRVVLAALVTGVLVSVPAQAVVVSGTLTGGTGFANGGTFQIVTPTAPFTVGGNNFGDNNVRAFDEKQNVVLLSNLAVDGGTIVAGTRVDSHFVTFDPATNRQVIGSVTFSRPILGVMTTTARMNASNFLGNSAVTYSLVSASGFEAGDSVTVAGNTLTYRMTASNPSDSFRVLTAVPEPTTWAMLIAGFGLVGAAARRRRSAGRAVLA